MWFWTYLEILISFMMKCSVSSGSRPHHWLKNACKISVSFRHASLVSFTIVIGVYLRIGRLVTSLTLLSNGMSFNSLHTFTPPRLLKYTGYPWQTRKGNQQQNSLKPGSVSKKGGAAWWTKFPWILMISQTRRTALVLSVSVGLTKKFWTSRSNSATPVI